MTRELYLQGIAQVKAYRLLQAVVSTTVKQFKFGSVSEWFLLCNAHYEGPIRVTDAANTLDVEVPLITKLTDNLIDAGLIERSTLAEDKRVKLLQATAKGQQLIPQVQAALEDELGKLLKGVRETQLLTYQKVLGMIVKNGG